MIENEDKRSYTARVFDLERAPNGRARQQHHCYGGHIHYKDHGMFVPCDTRLVPHAAGWEMAKASYNCLIPQYADGVFSFLDCFEGKSHIIQSMPQAAHVEGILANPNRVLYADAFGPGIDLRATTQTSGLCKEIVIRKRPVTAKDLHFDFELPGFDSFDHVIEKQAVDKTKPVAFRDQTLLVGKHEQYSYFRPAAIWDSDGLVVPVGIQIFRDGGKVFLRKTVSAEFLKAAVYPVFTDHPTTYYSGAGDGVVSAESYTSWDHVHDLATGNVGANYTNDWMQVDVRAMGASAWNIRHAYLPFDTSGIGSGYTVTAATFNIRPYSRVNTDDDGDDWLNVVLATQASTSSVVVADFNQCGAVNDPPEGATRIDIGSLSLSSQNAWTLNATGRGWVEMEGWTKLGLREGHDALDNPISFDGRSQISFNSSEAAEAYRPFLDITVAAAGGGASTQTIIIQ